MALNLWWTGDPRERFWMEITDRELLGDDLMAPQTDGTGREYWGYSLVTETQPGDVVLHWHRNWHGRRPALVGWSRVIGPLAVGEITWKARSKRGRALGASVMGPSWIMPCGGLNEFTEPIGKEALATHESAIGRIRAQLEERMPGRRPYFPFSFYRPGQLRAAQGYLTKFPAELVDAIPELQRQLAGTQQPTTIDTAPIRRSAGGRLQDTALRKAIELHAVNMAKRLYEDIGATEVVVLGAPYDLLVRGLGQDRHVEVKGSSATSVAVELTAGEVAHARNTLADLVVVDNIAWSRNQDGTYATSGGNLRRWEYWKPDDLHLAPTRFRYTLPD